MVVDRDNAIDEGATPCVDMCVSTGAEETPARDIILKYSAQWSDSEVGRIAMDDAFGGR
jgi:hypothetical protein